jgi:uncharacterized protein YjiS (DUF1127 family)
MSTTHAVAGNRPAAAAATMLGGLARFMAQLALAAIAARNRARTRRILSGLDDAALKDIGIARGQIDAVERDARYTPRFPGF